MPGDPGDAVIAAYRDTFWRHIFELSAGDEITVERNGQVFRYEVTGKKIIKPEDTNVVAPAPKRLALVARLALRSAQPRRPKPLENVPFIPGFPPVFPQEPAAAKARHKLEAPR